MLDKDFKEFAELLNSTGVEYLLVGGYALAAHGHPRYTGDLDIWLAPTTANVTRLLRALDLFGFGSLGLTKADFMQPETVVQLGFPPAHRSAHFHRRRSVRRVLPTPHDPACERHRLVDHQSE